MTINNPQQTQIEEKFLEALRHQLLGLREKVENEFSKENFYNELEKLKGDSIYPKFAFDTPEYVIIRFIGRISVSIGRRLGEIYDKVPRFVAAARFGLSAQQVGPKLNNLELDIGIRFSDLSNDDVQHVTEVIKKYFGETNFRSGVGIEIRYIFNPNDSSRLRKDIDMATYLQKEDMLPVYLVFSTLSPRDDAIARLARGGWLFLIGDQAAFFGQELFGLNLIEILDRPKIKSEIRDEVNLIMEILFKSYAFQKVVLKYKI